MENRRKAPLECHSRRVGGDDLSPLRFPHPPPQYLHPTTPVSDTWCRLHSDNWTQCWSRSAHHRSGQSQRTLTELTAGARLAAPYCLHHQFYTVQTSQTCLTFIADQIISVSFRTVVICVIYCLIVLQSVAVVLVIVGQVAATVAAGLTLAPHNSPAAAAATQDSREPVLAWIQIPDPSLVRAVVRCVVIKLDQAQHSTSLPWWAELLDSLGGTQMWQAAYILYRTHKLAPGQLLWHLSNDSRIRD